MAEKIKKQQKGKNIQIRLKNDDVAAGNFSNSFSITFTEQEFVMDFIMMQPQAEMGIVTNRIIMTPKKVKDLMAAMKEALVAYESINLPGTSGNESLN